MPRKQWGYYDPDPDPDPFPFALIILAALAVGGLAMWTNPNALNNIMYLLNPDLAKLEEERQKAQLESLRYIVLIVALVLGAIVVLWFLTRKKAKVRTRYFAYQAPLAPLPKQK